MADENPKKVICPQCRGKGEVPMMWGERRCPTCGGFGTYLVFKKPEPLTEKHRGGE